MKVAIVGGTGTFGRALGRRLHLLGEEVRIGSRDEQRGKERALEIGVEGGSNDEVVQGVDLVVLATKSNAALETGAELRDAIGETPVLCVASDLRFGPNGVLPGTLGRSLAEEVAGLLSAPVAAGLHTLAAAHLTKEDAPDEDALVCGDNEDAKRIALELADRLVAGRALDAGPLANARALEGMTAVILNVNKRYRAHAGVRITGLE